MGKEAFLNTGISHSRPRRSGFSWRVWCGSVSSAHTPHHRASVHPGRFHCPLQTSSRALIKTTLHELIRSESSASITSLPRACEQSWTSGRQGPRCPHHWTCALGPCGSGKDRPFLPKKTAACCSILAWGTPRTEEPGGLRLMGLPRAGHNWATKHSNMLTQLLSISFIKVGDEERRGHVMV